MQSLKMLKSLIFKEINLDAIPTDVFLELYNTMRGGISGHELSWVNHLIVHQMNQKICLQNSKEN